MAIKLLRLLPVLALLTIPAAASAQITNGDFENGNVGWIIDAPVGWDVQFPPTGGNPEGYAQIHSPFGNSGGTACISQRFPRSHHCLFRPLTLQSPQLPHRHSNDVKP